MSTPRDRSLSIILALLIFVAFVLSLDRGLGEENPFLFFGSFVALVVSFLVSMTELPEKVLFPGWPATYFGTALIWLGVAREALDFPHMPYLWLRIVLLVLPMVIGARFLRRRLRGSRRNNALLNRVH